MSIKSESSTFCGRRICSYRRKFNICPKYKHIGRRVPLKKKGHLVKVGKYNACDITDESDEEVTNEEDEDENTEYDFEDICANLNFPDTKSCMRETMCKNITFGVYCGEVSSLIPVAPRAIFRRICNTSALTEHPTQSITNSPEPSNSTERAIGDKLEGIRNGTRRKGWKGKINRQSRSISRELSVVQKIDGCPIHGVSCIALWNIKKRNPSLHEQKDLEIFNFTRCSPFRLNLCKNGIDQMNCTDHPDQIGLWCDINGSWNTISKVRVCINSIVPDLDSGPLCDDKLDITCPACGVHKHKICDGVQDCRDKSDEIGCNLMPMAEKKCKRAGGNGTELPIPLDWLLDGQKDCMDGIDENKENIRICGEGRSRRLTFNNFCENVFICRSGDQGYIHLDKLCDGTDSCNDERKICAVSRDLPDLPVEISNQKLMKNMSYCLPGLEELQKQTKNCSHTSFIFPEHEFFGVDDKAEVRRPKETQDCTNLYGEQYVYTSCLNNCSNSSTTCPLKHIPKYDSCSGQHRNRVGTFATNKHEASTSDNPYLTFFVKSSGGSYRNDFFVCDHGEKCIDYSQVCDLINDCGDGSDEINCTNHFSCGDRNNSSKSIYIPWTSYCDGKFDCPNLSDECNANCSKQILDKTILKVATITIGTIAVVANTIVIFNSFLSLSKCKTPIALANKSLVLLIGVGDFLIGGYLLLLTAADIFFSTLEDGHTGYCRNQIRWLVSYKCDILGVFSTVGSQISLFAMTVLSVLRLFGVLNSDRIQHQITRRSRVSVGACVFLIVISSFVVAIVPILPMVEFVDFFVSGLAFQKELKLFVGIKTRDELFAVIQEYFGRTRASRENDKQWSWRTMENLVKSMFSGGFDGATNDATNIDISRLGFYGNDGVCLFKFFVTPEDPQRHFVWSILVVNFLCFFTISVCYITSTVVIRMTAFAAKTMKERHGSTLSNIERSHIKRQKSLQQKIAFIIFTDFICWIPFIIVCALHFFKVIAANEWYAFFSVIVLPINSIINPFLYDEVFTNALSMLWKRLRIHGVTCSKLIEERRTISSSGNSSAGSVAAGLSSDPVAETPT